MQSNGREFPNSIMSSWKFYVVRNEPDNEITGRFRSVAEALEHALPGNVIYETTETINRKLLMVVDGPATEKTRI
jgi:hypothetical protein